MIQEALSSLKRRFLGSKSTMIADAKNVSDECFLLIFHRLDKKSLLNCMLTCRRLNNLISSDSFWVENARQKQIQKVLPPLSWRRAVAQKKFKRIEEADVDVTDFNFSLQRMVLSNRGYSPIRPEFIPLFENSVNNIIRGIRRSDDFAIRANGSGIEMETNGGHGCEPHPDVTKCFSFSFSTCSLYIYVDLVASGIDTWVLDHVRPKIRITQKINHRHDCSAYLSFAAQLNYQETQWIEENGREQLRSSVDKPRYKSIRKEWDQWTQAKWEDVAIEFTDYPSGLRHLTVLNEGIDGLFWDGFYGPKVANIEIQVILPDEPILLPLKADTERRREDDEPQQEMENYDHPLAPLLRRNRGMWGIPPALLHDAE